MVDAVEVVKKAEEVISKEGDIQKSIQILEKLLGELEVGPVVYSYDIPMVLNALGFCYRLLGDNKKAQAIFYEALKNAQNDFNKIQETNIKISLASLELEIGSLEKAMEYTRDTLRFCKWLRGEKYSKLKADNYRVLGNCYAQEKNQSKAMKYYDLSWNMATKVGYKKGLLAIYINRTELYESTLRLSAIKMLIKNLPDAKENYYILIPEICIKVGSLYTRKTQYERAEKYLLKGLEKAEALLLKKEQALAHESLGDLYLKIEKGNHMEYYNRALKMYKELGYIKKIENLEQKIKN